MKYIAFFDTDEYIAEKRSVNLAGVNVVDFTSEILSRLDNVAIISPVRTLNLNGFYPGRNININDRISLKIPPTFGAKSKLARALSIGWIQLWLLKTLLIQTKRNERVIVYHSLSIMPVIKIIKFIKKLQLTLEIREIYADVIHLNEKARRKELEYFKIADNYIFPTALINEQINTEKKPYTIASGIYRDEKRISSKHKDGKIHLIYAGTLDRLKNAGVRVAQLAPFLNENYVIHILGKGGLDTLEQVKNEIARISTFSKCHVLYHGELRGDEFKSYLQKCHIGLAIQDMSGKYNSTSFPSKIMTYLANGLEVICPKIDAISKSPVGDMLHFYESDTSECISEVIKSINFDDANKNNYQLSKLANSLESNLREMLYSGRDHSS